MDKLVKKQANELDLVTNQPQKFMEYELASLWKVFFARLFDLIIISLPFLITGYVVGSSNVVDNWVFLFINYASAIIVNVLYFAFIPIFLKGRTFGKIIFRITPIKLPAGQKITFKDLFLREMWMLIGPWMIYFILMVLSLVFAYAFNTTHQKLYYTFANIIYQFSLLVFAGWIIGLCISIRMQKNHQCMVDMKLKIIIANSQQQKQHAKSIEIASNNLKQTPGFLDPLALEEIANPPKSISVDKDQSIEDLKNIKKQKQAIERKGENDK